MDDKRVLLDLTPEELGDFLKSLGQPAFRAGQVFTWLHRGVAFADMGNLPATLRAQLNETCVDLPMSIQEVHPSKRDDTVKFLFACRDGNVIEGVLMRYRYGYSLCISTQVGCKMGCAFCASTLEGCVRSLSAGEMLSEVLLANRFLGERGKVGHVVLMGSGEPLDNYDQVVRFLRLLNAPQGLNISLRNVSLSTCGLVEGIRRLEGEHLPVTLSISLHAPNDEIRRQIMPVARTYPIAQLMEAVRAYVAGTGRRVVFEYALIDGLNIKALSDPALTGEWEYKLAQIAKGNLPREAFMHEIRDMTNTIVASAKNYEGNTVPLENPQHFKTPCPKCGGEVVENYRRYACTTPGCDFSLTKHPAGRMFEPEEVEELMATRHVGPLSGFISKMGRPFEAELKLTADCKLEFDFGDKPEEAEQPLDPAALEEIGTCPKCGGRVLIGPNAYICEHAMGDKKCDFRISRTILQQEIEPEQARLILTQGKSGLMTDFVSARTKRKFKAFLIWDPKGKKLGFEFPPREEGAKSETRKTATRKKAS